MAPSRVTEAPAPAVASPTSPSPVDIAPPPLVEVAAAPAQAAPEPAKEVPAAAPPEPPSAAEEPATTSASAGSLHVESLLVAPRYEHFTCRKPTSRISLRSSRVVNVCLAVTHRPRKAERLTLIWEKDGESYGKTRVQIPAAKEIVRTRAHMKLGESRLGSWTVRIVTGRDVPLGQATFDVVR